MSEIILSILHGAFLTFGLIIPLGVQNLFVFNQGSLHPSIFAAMPSIVTASLCDTLLITGAVLGLSTALMENPLLKLIILIAGCLFLFYMGFLIWKQSGQIKGKTRSAYSWKKQIIFACSVSLLNPHAIIDTIMVIGTNSLTYTGSAKISYTITCIIATWIWFFSLAIAGHYFRKSGSGGKWLQKINKIAALIIWVIALGLATDIIRLIRLSS